MTGKAPAPEVEVEEVAPASADVLYCLSRYFDELSRRFETGFDAAQSGAPTLDDFQPPRGCFIIMRVARKPVACGGFRRDPSGAAYIKRMWVSPDARGLGLGRRLLHELEDRARALGYLKARLETEKSLIEAQQLYRSAGYVEVPAFNDELYAHHWFEKPLT